MQKRIENKELSDAISRAQLDKLNLEIKQLKKKTGWFDRFAVRAGAISAIVALFVFLFSVIQFSCQQQAQNEAQKREQDIKIQQQINSDTSELLQLPKDNKATSARAAFLLNNLKSFIALKYNQNQNDNAEASAEIRKKTANFAKSVMNDFNFDESRDVYYYFALLNEWDDFKPYLKENPNVNQYILGKFMDSLLKLYSIDSSLVRGMTYEPARELFRYPSDIPKLSASQMEHHRLLLTNFRYTYQLLENEEIKEMGTSYFQIATCNPALTEQMLGNRFDPNLRPELKHCIQQ